MENNHKEERLRDFLLSVGGRYQTASFDSMVKTPANSKALEICKAFNKKKDNLYIYGPTGCGKTHLAIATALKHFDPLTKFDKPSWFLRRLRMCEKAVDELNEVKALIAASILAFDDLGIEKDSEFAVNSIYEVIDGRYITGGGGLIITTNLSLDQLAAKLASDRIPSRLAGMSKIVAMQGEDYRLTLRPI